MYPKHLPCVLSAVIGLAGSASANGSIEVSEAYVPEPPPVARMAAAYLRVVNQGALPARIIGAEADCAERVEIHRTVHANGRARMESVTTLDLAPGEALAFAPGGLHLMLHGTRLQAGDACQFRLLLSEPSEVLFEAPVRSRNRAPTPHHHAGSEREAGPEGEAR
ncbi:MAG: copper chaperone PCu(A)C [Myxococcota bacterium]